MAYVIVFVLALIVLLVIISIIRAARFRPLPEAAADRRELELDREKIAGDLAEMLRCRTVSDMDESKIDTGEFERFGKLLQERFPHVHRHCGLERIGKTGLLYCWKGESSSKPTVLMAHYDVVPADEKGWIKPAFEGIIENGEIWGRGALDTKSTLCGIMEAVEYLIKQGFVPKNDIWLSFSGDEEIYGETCPAIVSELERRGIKPAMVLDEGGAIVEKVFPGVDRPCALIGTAEKGVANVTFSMESQGGHSSTPPRHTIAGRLARAMVEIERHPFGFQLAKPVQEMFDTMGRHSGFALRIVFANLWLFKPVLNLVSRISGNEMYALMHTTCAITRMEGSQAFNVLPPKASFGANLRLLGSDTVDSVKERFRRIINDDDIRIDVVLGMNPTKSSDTDCEEWHKLKRIIKGIWPDVIVSPYLMLGCSDSRHFCRISDNVFRFSPMALSKEQRDMIHGHNERIPVETLVKTVEFYVNLIYEL
ncbi:MAG: M20/M25/M40 family metallo-hydrolase [Clostridiaceae bacterium]|nr:M20/M25/M40 family metallo-hydrolase [Clostridiaceae bacterium]